MDKFEAKLQCFRFACDMIWERGEVEPKGGKKRKATTQDVMEEANKIYEWVSGREDDK